MAPQPASPVLPAPPDPGAAAGVAADPARRTRQQRRQRRRRVFVATGLVGAVLTVPAGVSYAQALNAPGAGPWNVASVTWLGDHGWGQIINAVETWKYSRDQPSTTGTVAPTDLPAARGAATIPAVGSPATASHVPASIASAVRGPQLPGEGRWTPAGPAVTGAPTSWTTYFRPDAAHPGVLAGALLMDQSRTVAALVPGLTEPGPVPGALPSSVPAALQSSLVATFNAGFKAHDRPGGFALDGHTFRQLQAGGASLVVGRDGRIDVRAWTGGATAGPDVLAVRQNLALVVLGGRPAAGLDANAHRAWGSPGQQNQYTSRTGAGVTANGDLVVIEGGPMRLQTLADALVDAGAVTGMQLDIHTSQVSVDAFSTAGGRLTATPVLPAQSRAADRYLHPDQRDFVAVFVRGTAVPGVIA